MKRRILLLSFLVIFTVTIFVFWPDGNLQADDRSIFSASTKPNVMLILDNSGSMTDNDPGDSGYDFVVTAADYNSYSTYTISTGKTYTFASSGSATKSGYAKRIEALKRVTIQLLDVFRDKVKMGFANYLYPANVDYTRLIAGYYTYHPTVWHPPVLQAATWTSGTSYPCGAVIRSGVTDMCTSADPVENAAHNAQLEAMCDAVKAFTASGNTPLAESLDTCYGYYADLISATDSNTWTDDEGYTRIPQPKVDPPIQYTCQQNYVIMVTDGEPTHDEFGRGTIRDYSSTTSYTNKEIYDYSHKYTSAVVDSYTGGFNDVLNVAKWMFDHPFPGQINGGIRTWAVGMRLNATSETNLKLAVSPAYGHGTYLAGNDYASLSANLMTALESINLSSYAFSSYTSPKKLTTATDDTYVSYSGYFLNKEMATPIWEGHLKCLEIQPVGTTYNFVEQWDAAAKIYAQTESKRVLSTELPNQYVSGKFNYTPTNFISSATYSSDWKQSLNVTTDADATKIIKYIRGDALTRGVATTTSTLFLLADIFHSDVIYVGKPMQWKWLYNTSACDKTAVSTDTDCFQKFYNDNLLRQKVVYAASNDGVVHTINADIAGNGGQEMSGFLPDEILPKLRNIAIDKNYTYTADGRMTSADIYSPTNKWQTILAFGMREGGKFYYCRNVTNPGSQTTKWKFPEYEAAATITAINTSTKVITLGTKTGTFSANQILVNEKRTARTTISAAPGTITVTSTASLAVGDRVYALPAYAKYVGETWGKPVIGRLKIKKGAASTQEIWVTILTAGFSENSTSETVNEGKALFIVDADSGALLWYLAYASADSITNDYYVKNNADLNYPIPQSLTAVDLDNDTYIDTLYFGNTAGNLFKLNISNPQTTSWIPKLLVKGIAGTQPIYIAPSVSYDQCYKLWLHFGTGNRNITQTAPTGQFIAIMDDESITYPLTTATTAPVLQQLTWTTGTAPTPDTMTSTPDLNMKGWYFNFLDDMETLFDPDPVVIPDQNIPYLFFNSYQPKTTVSGTDPCGSGGNMHVYSIRLPFCFSNGNFEISGEREDARLAGGGMVDDGYLQYKNTAVTGSITTKEFEKFTLQYPGGVFYFKEIIR